MDRDRERERDGRWTRREKGKGGTTTAGDRNNTTPACTGTCVTTKRAVRGRGTHPTRAHPAPHQRRSGQRRLVTPEWRLDYTVVRTHRHAH